MDNMVKCPECGAAISSFPEKQLAGHPRQLDALSVR
jgi:predicted nucleic-acid-binding Zn-ribbon protein